MIKIEIIIGEETGKMTFQAFIKGDYAPKEKLICEAVEALFIKITNEQFKINRSTSWEKDKR